MSPFPFPLNTFASRILMTIAVVGIAVQVTSVHAENSNAEEAIDSRVTNVTLYRTQALVTRQIELDGDPGTRELVIGDLPENIVEASLFAEAGPEIEVRAVQYRSRAVSDSPREEVRVIEQEIQSLLEKRMMNEKQSALILKQSKYLDKLESFTPPTVNFDLGRGVLDAKAIEEMTKFSFGQRRELMEAEIRFANERREIEKELTLAQRKIREITNGSTRQERQAVLFVQKTARGKQQIRLNYLTNACGWSPSYTVRAESGAEKIRIEYNGLIQQMSGEDWQNVKLTLSTASPALSAAGPGLAPFRLTLSPNSMSNPNVAQMESMGMGMGGMGGPAQQAQAMQQRGGSKGAFESLLRSQNEAIARNRVAITNSGNLETAWSINSAVNNFDWLTIAGDGDSLSIVNSSDAEGGEQPALSYEIASPVSLDSRNNQQMVRVLTTDLKSSLYHVATPVLTSYVYREAELNNDSSNDLLAGPLTVYLDDRFVGRTEIPTVARGQTFVVGLGADSQLRSRRELDEKSNEINGGNRETNLTYRLVVENYKDKPEKVRIVDRIPISDDESDIRVTIADRTTKAISTDAVYVRTQRPKGILRWDVEVAARAVGEKAHEVDYSYKLEYDRNYVVSLPDNLKEQETEYQEMEKSRLKR